MVFPASSECLGRRGAAYLMHEKLERLGNKERRREGGRGEGGKIGRALADKLKFARRAFVSRARKRSRRRLRMRRKFRLLFMSGSFRSSDEVMNGPQMADETRICGDFVCGSVIPVNTSGVFSRTREG